jgi:hypothetical protein
MVLSVISKKVGERGTGIRRGGESAPRHGTTHATKRDDAAQLHAFLTSAYDKTSSERRHDKKTKSFDDGEQRGSGSYGVVGDDVSAASTSALEGNCVPQ